MGAKILLPALLRVAKRLPEVMLPVMEAVFGMLDAELSSQSVSVTRELLPQLRHAKEAVRCIQQDMPCWLLTSSTLAC